MLLLFVRLCGNLGPQKYNFWVRVGLMGCVLGQQCFLGTNMLVSPTRNGRVGGLSQCSGQVRVVLHCSGI